MIDWTKVNPNILLAVSASMALGTVGLAAWLWISGNKDGVTPLLGIMLPILFALFGVKQTQNTQLTKQAADKASVAADKAGVGVAQNEKLISQVAEVKREVTK